MKIYNFGNDYAFQRKQESAEKSKSVEPIAEQETNAGNQICGNRERGVENTSADGDKGEGKGERESAEEEKPEKEVRKKKKEAGAKARQEEYGQV